MHAGKREEAGSGGPNLNEFEAVGLLGLMAKWMILVGVALLAGCLAAGVLAAPAAEPGLSKLAGLDAALNSTSRGFAWVTAIDEEELEMKAKVSFLEEGEALEGGFASLDSMLQWAIEHSDPEKLKGGAREASRLTPQELAKRRADIKELMERLKMPSDAELMKIAINDLLNSSLSAENRKRALDELLELVEPIDNANDLNKLGGLEVVISELERPEEELRTAAAWVLGKASQNNYVVQSQLLHYRVLPKLMQMIRSSSEEEAVKALYAVSAVIRNYPSGQEAFYLEGGATLLQELLSNSSIDARLRRKSLFLLGDLAEQLAEIGGNLRSYVPHEDLLKSVVHLLTASDLDTQEKALMAVQSLARISSTHEILKNVCNLDVALENLRLQLEQLMLNEDNSEFARDMERLREQVVKTLEEQEETR